MRSFCLSVGILFCIGCNYETRNVRIENIISKTDQNKISQPASPGSTPAKNSFPVETEHLNDRKAIMDLLTGIWKREDGKIANGCSDRLKIFFADSDESFCVEGNQIYLSVRYEINLKIKNLNLFFVKPDDLGPGGLGLPWETYDRKRPIATIDISEIHRNKISLKWNGFYEKKSKRIHDYGKDYEGVYLKETDNNFSENSKP